VRLSSATSLVEGASTSHVCSLSIRLVDDCRGDARVAGVRGHAVWECSTLASGVASAALGSVERQYASVIPARASATGLESLIGATSQVLAADASEGVGRGWK
jgi:hypothetical protein